MWLCKCWCCNVFACFQVWLLLVFQQGAEAEWIICLVQVENSVQRKGARLKVKLMVRFFDELTNIHLVSLSITLGHGEWQGPDLC